MRVLLDTNIIIHRESHRTSNMDVGHLFNWLDKLHIEKCIHPHTRDELAKFQNQQMVDSMSVKLDSYSYLKTIAQMHPNVVNVCQSIDINQNDIIDSELINEAYQGRVDFLITEDRKMHRKADVLCIKDRVFTIDAFLEKVIAENPQQPDYEVLSVRKEYFGNIDLSDPFFDSFKKDYSEFEQWFNRKSDNFAYVCRSETNSILAFLYLKVEENDETYPDIQPYFIQNKRLKIGTFKVALNGYKLGERFLKIIFDNAMLFKVNEIYVTIFNNTVDQQRLSLLMEDWGFYHHGHKNTQNGRENVYVRNLRVNNFQHSPKTTFPFLNGQSRKFLCPIYPQYHTELLPDSILNNESPADFVDNTPSRNALAKVYISRSFQRDLRPGDIIIFYRTKFGGPAHYTSVTTTLAIVESVNGNFRNFEEFRQACRKRSVFSDNGLMEHWEYQRNNRPFIVNFLYAYSLPRRPNLQELRESKIVMGAPRGFEEISDPAFRELLRISNADNSIIIN
jgi:predicted nucleic acid-binding protein